MNQIAQDPIHHDYVVQRSQIGAGRRGSMEHKAGDVGQTKVRGKVSSLWISEITGCQSNVCAVNR